MENNKDIGRAFRNKLEALDKSPSDRLWANIEKDLKVKKRRRPFFWLLPLALTLGLSLGGYYYFSDGFGKYNLNSNGNKNNDNGNDANGNYNGNNNDSNNIVNSKNGHNNGENIDAKHNYTLLNSDEGVAFEKGKEQLSPVTAIENNTYQEAIEQEDPIEKNTNKTQVAGKLKTGTGYSKGKFNQKLSAPTNKTLYNREATRITVTSKKLVKSTPEFDEYEVVKKYTYVVKKKKAIVKTKNKASGTTLNAGKIKSKKDSLYKNSNKKKNAKTKPYLKRNRIKNKPNNTKKTPSTITKPDSVSSLEDNVSGNRNPDSKVDGAENKIEIEKKDSIQTPKINSEKKKRTVAAIKKDSIPTVPKKNKLFEVFLYGSPTLSYSTSKKSSIDSRLNNNERSTNVTFSYGGYLCYGNSDNLSIRFGIGRNTLSFKTENVPVNTLDYSNIDYSEGFSNEFIYNESNHSESMTLIQDLTYTEVPLEVKYKLIDRKIGVSTIFGINYLFLGKNKVSAITSNGNKYSIGKTENLLDRTFGLNFGFGVDYKIAKKLKFNVEPILKYHIKDYVVNEKTGLFSVNILTGLQYQL